MELAHSKSGASEKCQVACQACGSAPSHRCDYCRLNLCEKCVAKWHTPNPLLAPHEKEHLRKLSPPQLKITHCCIHDGTPIKCFECGGRFVMQSSEAKILSEMRSSLISLAGERLDELQCQEAELRRQRSLMEKRMLEWILDTRGTSLRTISLEAEHELMWAFSGHKSGKRETADLQRQHAMRSNTESLFCADTVEPLEIHFRTPVIVRSITFKFNHNVVGSSRFRCDRVRLDFFAQEEKPLASATFDLPWQDNSEVTPGAEFAPAQNAYVSGVFPVGLIKKIILHSVSSTYMPPEGSFHFVRSDKKSLPHYSFSLPFGIEGISTAEWCSSDVQSSKSRASNQISVSLDRGSEEEQQQEDAIVNDHDGDDDDTAAARA